MKAGLCATVVAAAVLAAAATSEAETRCALDAREVTAAMEFAEGLGIGPHELQAIHPKDEPGAAVFTPFIRVAMAAGRARTGGQALTPADLTADLCSPDVWFAFELSAADLNDGFRGEWTISIERQQTRGRTHRVKPLWMRPADAGPAWLADGAMNPDARLRLVAAFPYRDLKGGDKVILSRILPKQGGLVHRRIGLISGDALARWR